MSVIMVPRDYPDIQSAVNAAISCDEIYVEDGMYREQVVIEEKNNIRIKAAGDKVILDGNGIKPPTIGFNLIKCPGTEIVGFKIKGFDKGIIVNPHSDNTNINSNTIWDIRDDGVKIKANNCGFVNNHINECKDDALKIIGNNCNVMDNYIRDAGEEGIEINGNNNTVKGNTVINSSGAEIEVTGCINSIRDNRLVSRDKPCILDTGASNAVHNNC